MIGCQLIKFEENGNILKGIIVETEAYSQEEEACHGYKTITNSNKTLFGLPGHFYVYKSYGLHYCLNVVTDKDNFASGVLIRSLFIPSENHRIASGPGLLTKRFSIDKRYNSLNINQNQYLTILQKQVKINKYDLIQTTRIGISKATNLEWRWYLKGSRSISKRKKGDRVPKENLQPKFAKQS